MKIIKVELYADEFKITEMKQRKPTKPKTEKFASEDSGRFDNNIARARARIFELARCNEWEYFCTLTLSSEFDRSDLRSWREKFSQWLRDYRKKGYDVKYLLVPEQHQNGAWHMHGFFSGIGEVAPFAAQDIGNSSTKADVAAYKAAELNSEGYLNWKDYSRRWGYCSLAPIKSAEAVSRYITKYVTKSMAMDNLISGAHLFYASRGLKGAEVVACDSIPLSDREFREGLSDCKHFCNEYLEQWWTKNPEKIAPLVSIATGKVFEFTFSEK